MTSAVVRSARALSLWPYRVIASCMAICVLVVILTTSAAAQDGGSVPSEAAQIDSTNDPLEPMNRFFFGFNRILDKVLLKPAAKAYRFIFPDAVRNSIGNFLSNLGSPVVFANDLLQGEDERAGVTFGRFFINTTIGVLGIFDPATTFGYERHEEDFGQTLASYGAGEGPYLMLPILGPSNPRDAVGTVVDFLLDPLTWLAPREYRIGRYVVNAVDQRERNIETLDDLEAGSVDFYATIRTVYRQHRAAQIRNGGAPIDDPAYESIFEEFDDDEPLPTEN